MCHFCCTERLETWVYRTWKGDLSHCIRTFRLRWAVCSEIERKRLNKLARGQGLLCVCMYVCINVVQSIHEHMAIKIGMSKKQGEHEARIQTHTPFTSEIRSIHLSVAILRFEQILAEVSPKARWTHVTEALRQSVVGCDGWEQKASTPRIRAYHGSIQPVSLSGHTVVNVAPSRQAPVQ